MSNNPRDVLITGIGLVSCLGEGHDAHWNGLTAAKPIYDDKNYAPFVVHPIAPINFDLQIPKKGDQRQMEPWQRIGCYSAGLALDNAGIKGNTEILSRVDMLVAAGGGERDTAVDGSILTGLKSAQEPGRYLNERLMNDLRHPVPGAACELLAGNISIVFGVVGSSRTFMGEETSGVDALRIAAARIGAGQSEIGLVGGAYNSQRMDVLLQLSFGREALKAPYQPTWERGTKHPGIAAGSLGAFLVIESRKHAEARGAKAYAKLSYINADRARRDKGEMETVIADLWNGIPNLKTTESAVISSATGASPATPGERNVLEKVAKDMPIRVPGSVLGHGVEAQFPLNIGLAALAISRGGLWPACDPTGFEKPWSGGKLNQVVVTSISAWRGEGVALVEAA